RNKMFKKRYIIWLLIIAVPCLTAICWQVYVSQSSKMSASEKQKSVTEILGRGAREEKIDPGPQNYNGKFFSLTYPGSLLIDTKINPQATMCAQPKERLKLSGSDPRADFTAMVNEAKGLTNVADDSGVMFRESQ